MFTACCSDVTGKLYTPVKRILLDQNARMTDDRYRAHRKMSALNTGPDIWTALCCMSAVGLRALVCSWNAIRSNSAGQHQLRIFNSPMRHRQACWDRPAPAMNAATCRFVNSRGSSELWSDALGPRWEPLHARRLARLAKGGAADPVCNEGFEIRW